MDRSKKTGTARCEQPSQIMLDRYYGHAAYTRLNTMLFNTTEIAQALYP